MLKFEPKMPIKFTIAYAVVFFCLLLVIRTWRNMFSSGTPNFFIDSIEVIFFSSMNKHESYFTSFRGSSGGLGRRSKWSCSSSVALLHSALRKPSSMSDWRLFSNKPALQRHPSFTLSGDFIHKCGPDTFFSVGGSSIPFTPFSGHFSGGSGSARS